MPDTLLVAGRDVEKARYEQLMYGLQQLNEIGGEEALAALLSIASSESRRFCGLNADQLIEEALNFKILKHGELGGLEAFDSDAKAVIEDSIKTKRGVYLSPRYPIHRLGEL